MDPSHGARLARVVFGSAQLYVDRMPDLTARTLVDAAVQAGVTHFDTAPLYGHGRSEVLIGERARGVAGAFVTSKVGLEPATPPSALRAAAGVALGRLPSPLVRGLKSMIRGSPTAPDGDQPSGRFGIDAVTRSIDRSLSRLGRIDRLLLHEVHPADVTDELLAVLDGYRRRGDIAALGVATANAMTLEALRRSHGAFTVAHVSVDPMGAALPDVSAWPSLQLVGHGALGAGGRTLARLRSSVMSGDASRRQWASAVEGTAFAGEDGDAAALLAHALRGRVSALLVATRRPERLRRTLDAASVVEPLPPAARRFIEQLSPA